MFGRCGAGQHCYLVRSELLAECVEPALLKVLLADDYEVEQRGQDAVVKILELVEDCASLPAGSVEVGNIVEEFDEPDGARWRPSRRPGRAVVPELEDRCAGVGGPSGGVRSTGRFGLVCGVNESGSVVDEPSGESVVSSSFAELFKDLLAKAEDCVLICR